MESPEPIQIKKLLVGPWTMNCHVLVCPETAESVIVDPAEGGTYCLVLHLPAPMQITVGRLGTFDFPAGYYLYVGSALNGLEARLARHRRQDKALHWHIDYLLQHATLIETWSAVSPERLECRWAEIVRTLPDAFLPIPRFGASDCRCPAHLIYFPTRPEFSLFYSQAVPGLVLVCQRFG